MSNQPENNEVLTAEQVALVSSVIGDPYDQSNVKVPVPVRPAFYIPGSAPVGSGLRDSNGTSYIVEKGGAIRRVGPKKRKI